MSSGLPFNEYGQILSQGGDIFAALKLERGLTEQEVLALMLDRFKTTDNDAVLAIILLAQLGRQAAQQVNALGPSVPLGAVNIPINPYLYAGGTLGRRYRAIANYFYGDEAGAREVRVDLPDIIDWQDVYETIGLEGQERARGCYRDFGFDNPDNVPMPDLYFIYIVGAF